MVSRRTADQLVVIVGPTASGKSELAIKVAKAFDGEIISADSRTVYKGLDIGTAKPTLSERAGISHYGFDLVEPDQMFSAAQFQQLANGWIKAIQARGKLPIMVGGTGLYVDSVLFDYKFGRAADAALRRKFEVLPLEKLWEYCDRNNIELPENIRNKRYIIRAIEQGGVNTRRNQELHEHTIVVGITPKLEVLQKRIAARAEHIFAHNIVKETTSFAKKYSWNAPGLSGVIYPIIRHVIDGKLTKQEAAEQVIKGDWHLAKRQLTWFKRNPYIRWSESAEQSFTIIKEYLSKLA